jgi:hypothetical protein
MQAQEKPTPWYIRIVKYFFFKVLVFDLALVALTAASFWFLGPWSALAYSDRLFWVGVVVILAGGLVLMVMSFVRRDDQPRMAPEPGEPRNVLRRTPSMLSGTDKRYNISTQIWLIGLGCIGFSILMYNLLS